MLRMKGSARVMQQGQAQGLWVSGWFVLCQSSLLCTLLWRTRASSVLGWFPSSAGGSPEPWNIQPLAAQRPLCHLGTTSSIWMLKLCGDFGQHHSPVPVSLPRHLSPQTREGRICGWCLLCLSQILSLLGEEGEVPLWRTWTIYWGQLLSPTAELQILQKPIFLETENYIHHGKTRVYLLINKKQTTQWPRLHFVWVKE